MSFNIRRGEMYYADLSPTVGCEQGGCRPVLVIQNNKGNRHSPTVVVAAVTGNPQKAKLPTHYMLPASCGLSIPSVVLLEQVRTIDKSRFQAYIGTLSRDTMKGIDHAITVSMGVGHAKPAKKRNDTMLLTLCGGCATQFYNSPEHTVRRANPKQDYKEPCVWCSDRFGWDYKITRKVKQK